MLGVSLGEARLTPLDFSGKAQPATDSHPMPRLFDAVSPVPDDPAPSRVSGVRPVRMTKRAQRRAVGPL